MARYLDLSNTDIELIAKLSDAQNPMATKKALMEFSRLIEQIKSDESAITSQFEDRPPTALECMALNKVWDFQSQQSDDEFLEFFRYLSEGRPSEKLDIIEQILFAEQQVKYAG
jgi:hypothetical protein